MLCCTGWGGGGEAKLAKRGISCKAKCDLCYSDAGWNCAVQQSTTTTTDANAADEKGSPSHLVEHTDFVPSTLSVVLRVGAGVVMHRLGHPHSGLPYARPPGPHGTWGSW